MADYTVALESLRANIETSEGNGGTPTRLIPTGPPGNVDASDIRKRTTIEDRRPGYRTSLRNTYSGIESSMLRLSSVPAYYENIHWWMSLLAPSGAGVPGTVDTSAYTRTFTPTETTTTNTYGTGYYTGHFQYSSQDFASTLVDKIPAMAITNLTLNFDKRASGTDTGLTMDVELTQTQGTATAGTAFDGSLSETTHTAVLGNQLTAYVTSSYATIGGTADNQIMSASFNLVNPLTWHDGMDGTNAHTSGHWAQQWTPTLTVTRRFSDTTELDAYVSKATRYFRFEAVGDVVGASTATNIFRLDAVGSYMDHRRTQVDGLYYAELDFELVRDSTLTTSWQVFVRNSVAAAATAT